MGFIEEERKRKAAELSAQQKNSSLMEKQKEQVPIRIPLSSWEQEKINRRALREKSKQQFEQSGLGGMITELGKIGSHKKVITWDYSSENYYEVRILGNGSDYLFQDRVTIKITADGKINIQGDKSHGTTLSRDKWQGKNGQEELEKALGKAYGNKERVCVADYRPSSGGGG